MVSESVGGEARVRSARAGPDEWRFRSFAGRLVGEPSVKAERAISFDGWTIETYHSTYLCHLDVRK
jgi:hypothetical protein